MEKKQTVRRRAADPKKSEKYELILDTFWQLMLEKDLEKISVSEIARAAGIAKGGIYYYFSSKEEMLDAMIRRNYEKTLERAKQLTEKTDVSPLLRSATIFHICIVSYRQFNRICQAAALRSPQEMALLHQKHIRHLQEEIKPVLVEILRQGIAEGDFDFDHPEALADIILIVLTVKLDNSIVPASQEEISETIQGLIHLMESGAGFKTGALDFLKLL